MLVTGQVGLDGIAGPLGIVGAIEETYQEASPAGAGAVVLSLMNFMVLITVNLAIFNLLPLPALDGGRLIFLFIEAIRGKRVPPEREGMVHLIGFVLLMILMVVVLFNDIFRLWL